MHIALVMDAERLAVDGAALERLAVALAADGVKITRVRPPMSMEASLARLIPVRELEFDGSPLFRRSRLGALSSALEEDPPDAFVSFGPRAFAAAAELAEDLEAALIAMVSSEDELTRTPLRKHGALLDALGVSTGPLVARAGRQVSHDLVSVMPLGVAIPTHRTPSALLSVAIAGNARDVGAYRAVYAALADISSAAPDLQVAIEFPPGHDPKLWALARQHRIQGLLNGVTRLEDIRPLVLECDVIVLPEPVRGTRTLVLEAMAAGRLVVAIEDAMAQHLMDGVTALMAQEREAREWTRLLTRAILDPAGTSGIRAEGALRVAAQFGSSRCAANLLEACVTAVRGPLIPFRQA